MIKRLSWNEQFKPHIEKVVQYLKKELDKSTIYQKIKNYWDRLSLDRRQKITRQLIYLIMIMIVSFMIFLLIRVFIYSRQQAWGMDRYYENKIAPIIFLQESLSAGIKLLDQESFGSFLVQMLESKGLEASTEVLTNETEEVYSIQITFRENRDQLSDILLFLNEVSKRGFWVASFSLTQEGAMQAVVIY